MPKTIRVSDQTWQLLESKRQTMLTQKISSQLQNGKLERTDVTFEEVILKLIEEAKEK
jgi:hypothetical protein